MCVTLLRVRDQGSVLSGTPHLPRHLQLGTTLLHRAACNGHLEVVRLLLLDQGVDKDATEKVVAVRLPHAGRALS